MKKKVLLIPLALVLAASLVAIGCPRPQPVVVPDRVGVVTSIGGLGDKSFNDFSFAGARQAAEEMGVGIDVVEPLAIGDFEGLQRDMAIAGEYKVIVAVGFLQRDALAVVAREFPRQRFIIVDSVVDLPNVTSLIFRENEGSFLVGVLAGMMTETGRVGFVGGMDVPIIRRFQAGFAAGALWGNPDVIVDVSYAGSFRDPAAGKEHALAHYGRGADIIFAAAGKTNLGVFDAAVGLDKLAIGVDVDQAHIAPAHIVASMIKGIDTAVYDATLAALKETIEPGMMEFGLAEGVAGICFLMIDHVRTSTVPLPEKVRARVTEARLMIIDGLINVPDEHDL